MRGVFTAGVFDAFMKKGLKFRHIVGASAGTMQAVCYVAEQPGRNIRINTTYCADPRYMGLRHMVKEGSYFNFDFMFGELAHTLDPVDEDAFNRSKTEIQAILTDSETGKPVYMSSKEGTLDDFMDACRASESIPLVSKTVFLKGHPYVDGGLAMPLATMPYEIPFYCRKPVYILTRQKGYRKKPTPKSFRALLSAVYGKKYPAVVESMCSIPARYNEKCDRLEELEAEGKVFVIRPEEPVDVGRAEKNAAKIRKLHGEGYRIAMEKYDELMRWIHE